MPAVWREQMAGATPDPALFYLRAHTSSSAAAVRRQQPPDYYNMFTRLAGTPLLYACNVCGKHVSNRWHHSFIHQPQTNCCPMCQQTFTRRDNMKVHIKVKHGNLIDVQ